MSTDISPSIIKRRIRQSKHGKTPAAIAKRKARDTTIEGRARKAAYYKRPEVKARIKASTYSKPLTLDRRLKVILHGITQRINRLNNKGRRLDNTLTYDDLLALYNKQGGLCAISGQELTPARGQHNTISIDRIDNTKGYTIDNIQLVTAQVNTAKNKWTEEQFIAMCEAVVKRQQ